MFDKLVAYVTFLPWILIFTVSIINNLKNDNYKQFSWKYLKKNIFKIFRLDTLFLVLIFFYFSSFGKDFVNKYLFAVMCLYLFINYMYERKEATPKNFYKDHIFHFISIGVIMLIPFILYYINGNILLAYKIMLILLFIEYIIIILINSIYKFIKKKKGN